MSRFRDTFGERDVLLLTLDALRYDVAVDALRGGHTPTLAGLLPHGWELRHAAGTFTLPAHEALFAGFFPTPPAPGPHPRPVAVRFPGSRSVARDTLVLDGACLVSAYAAAGYRTLCFGGTGFFDPATALGARLVSRFHEAHFARETGVTSRHAPRIQFGRVAARLAELPASQRVFLFVNAAATHPPTRIFASRRHGDASGAAPGASGADPGASGPPAESPATQLAALAALDRHLPVLLGALRARGGAVGIVCADHGTCFGEDGYVGHRHAHPLVMQVPYAEVEVTA